jgi:hypothetical protein
VSTLPDLRDRLYVSQYSADNFGLVVHVAGVPANADGAVTATFATDGASPIAIFTNRAATNPAPGVYEVAYNSADVQAPNYYTLTWTYSVNSVAQTYVTYVEVGVANPDYDSLTPEMKQLIESVLYRFADCFDSPGGGPNLQVYFQTHWGRGRVAQMARIACGRLNTMSQPSMTYSIDAVGAATFPLVQWGPLLESMTYTECLRHLIRSYVEQPELAGGAVTRLDRRDYTDRWRNVLRDEEDILKGQLDTFKIRNMGFGKPRVLVSGGVFGRYGPTRFAGSVAARPRYWTRFY